MPTWKNLINGTLVLFLIVFAAYVGLAIYGVSRDEVKVADILVFLGGAAMMLLGMVVQAVKSAADKALESDK
jgi:hypothetical protein